MKNTIKYLLTLILIVTTLSACGSASGNEVTVTLTDFGFEASRYEFEAGQTYTFIITNEGAIPHEFVIAEPITEDAHHEEGEMEHEGLVVEVEEDELPQGATVRVEVTFPSPAPDEPLEFACHIEGHYEAGMKAPITVK
ncbi:MAG TPA: cupredoxin domain-containing protein [Anaerolineales bacterium]|nr:cupredoxin domain-containing protein [Anaerolineales bacterium]